MQLSFISFGNRRVDVRRGLKNYSTDVDLRPANNLIVRNVATLNESNGVLAWLFTLLDPAPCVRRSTRSPAFCRST